MNTRILGNTHPLVLFWIGLLTGAIIVALVFMVQQNQSLQNNLAPQMNIQKMQQTGQKQKMGSGTKNFPEPIPYMGQKTGFGKNN